MLSDVMPVIVVVAGILMLVVGCALCIAPNGASYPIYRPEAPYGFSLDFHHRTLACLEGTNHARGMSVSA